MAYDDEGNGKVEDAIEILKEKGINPRRIVVYALYNYKDTPDSFLERVRKILSWGAVCYPMRYQPVDTLEKDSFVSENWTSEQLEMIADARRVLGYNGAFPPYEGLIKKLNGARDFEQAFRLRPIEKGRKSRNNKK